jgi:hypothetical protein
MKTDALPASTLNFNPTVGMTIEGAAPDDPDHDPWHLTLALAPKFAGPPLYVHPHQEESFEVLSGVLDVCVDGQWRELGPANASPCRLAPRTRSATCTARRCARSTGTPRHLTSPTTWPACTNWSIAASSAHCLPRTHDQ